MDNEPSPTPPADATPPPASETPPPPLETPAPRSSSAEPSLSEPPPMDRQSSKLEATISATLEWRRKRTVHDFFPNSQVPNADLITKPALAYLGVSGKLNAVTGAASYLLSSRMYLILLTICLISLTTHLVLVLIRSEPIYLAVVNKLECAWYLGSNVSSANYRAVPFALQPQPLKPEEDLGPLQALAEKLLARWRMPEQITGLERCILSHRSSDCRFIGGVHKCKVDASPRFCSHYHLVRHRELHQVRTPEPPLVVPTGDNMIRLPEADPLVEVPGQPAVSEDCLYLSIGRPRDYETGYPVIVFVTGSGYVSETTRSLGQDSLLHSAASLPDQLRAVVVRIGYRLGFHGSFRPHGDDTGARVINYGLVDLVRGLEHLRKIVKEFGGDFNRITIVGHGSGAAMVMALLQLQRRTGKRLVHAAWLSSGPSRIPESAPELLKALKLIYANRWTNVTELKLQCPVDNVTECRRELETMDEGRLLVYLTANEDVYKAWTRTGYLDDWSPNLASLIRRGTLSVPGGAVPPAPPLEWLAPDGVTLIASPTEIGQLGLSSWDDIPIVFANVAEHYEGFPGFRASDKWHKVWQKLLATVKNMGYAGSPDKLIARLKQPDMARGDAQGLLTAVRVATLLRFICPYRYLAKSLTKRSRRSSPIYHFVQRYSLKYPAKFLAIGGPSKHTGAFYGLDLLLMLGKAPRAAENWDRRDQAFMQHFQSALSTFASGGEPPSSWYTVEDGYTVLADSDGQIWSTPPDDALAYCDTIRYDEFPKLRTIV